MATTLPLATCSRASIQLRESWTEACHPGSGPSSCCPGLKTPSRSLVIQQRADDRHSLVSSPCVLILLPLLSSPPCLRHGPRFARGRLRRACRFASPRLLPTGSTFPPSHHHHHHQRRHLHHQTTRISCVPHHPLLPPSPPPRPLHLPVFFPNGFSIDPSSLPCLVPAPLPNLTHQGSRLRVPLARLKFRSSLLPGAVNTLSSQHSRTRETKHPAQNRHCRFRSLLTDRQPNTTKQTYQTLLVTPHHQPPI